MVNGATTKPKRKRIVKKDENVIAPKKRVIKKRKQSAPELESMPRKKKKVADPEQHSIEEFEVDDINAPIAFDISAHAPSMEEIANFSADKKAGFSVDKLIEQAEASMGSIFTNLTNDNKTFGSKMDSIFQLQMLSLLPTVQNLDDTMYDERKAHAAVKLNDTINHLKNSLQMKQQFELKEEIDLHHPKLQKAFAFLTEAFFYVLTEVGIDSSVKALIINGLSLKMMGFEDELNKRFKGVAFSLLDQIENPLLDSLPNVKQLEVIQEAREKEKQRLIEVRAREEEEEIIEVIPDRKA